MRVVATSTRQRLAVWQRIAMGLEMWVWSKVMVSSITRWLGRSCLVLLDLVGWIAPQTYPMVMIFVV